MPDQTYLRRIRMLARLTLVLGVAASSAANVLHARDNLVSQGIAAWPPLALLLTVELISRVPVRQRGLAVIRIVATTAIAGIAAWVSYWHMAGVCARYGESPVSARLMPLCVDGLVAVRLDQPGRARRPYPRPQRRHDRTANQPGRRPCRKHGGIWRGQPYNPSQEGRTSA